MKTVYYFAMNEAESLLNFFRILNFISFLIFLICVFFLSYFYLIFFINLFKKKKNIDISKPKNRFAILIPARDESLVIENILTSLKMLNYPKKLYDVFVIVERSEDPTVNIVNKYGYKCFIRENIGNRKTKGFALQEAIIRIKKMNLKYDSYVIFDADNIVDSNFLKEMNDKIEKGYEIGVGCRKFTNLTKNWMTITSGILFTFLNVFTNSGRSTYFNKSQITGTGYYINSKIIDKAEGWIWTGLTEDVELTRYAYKNNIKVGYFEKAVYFDEQADTYKIMHKQHVRWVWGFFERKNYSKSFNNKIKTQNLKNHLANLEIKISIYPFMIFILSELINSIISFILIFVTAFVSPNILLIPILSMLVHLLIVYGSFMFIALLVIFKDNENLKFNIKQIFIAIFMYPIFFLDFLFAFIDGLFHKSKRDNWDKINHSGEIIVNK